MFAICVSVSRPTALAGLWAACCTLQKQQGSEDQEAAPDENKQELKREKAVKAKRDAAQAALEATQVRTVANVVTATHVTCDC